MQISDKLYLMYAASCIGEIAEYNDGCDNCEYDIKIYWDEWDKAGQPIIAGIDTDLRKDVYSRDSLPYLLSVKCPLYERADEFKAHILWKVGMDLHDGRNYFGYIKRTRGINTTYDTFYYGQTPTDFIDKDIYDITNDDMKTFVSEYNEALRRRIEGCV